MLTVHQNDEYTLDSAKSITLAKDSKKVMGLIDWFAKNSKGWKSINASLAAPNFFLNGNDFKLLVYNEGIVIGFTDNNGRPRQYSKKVSKSEFNFLLAK